MIPALVLGTIPDELSEDAFWEFVGTIENETIEFKRKPANLTEVIPAMAMTIGGVVVLGIDDDRQIVGCPPIQKVRDFVTSAAHDVEVDVTLSELRVGDKTLTLVRVPAVDGRIVTTPDGRLLRRVGSSNRPLIGDALGRFVREREGRSAEDDLVDLSVDDLDLALINRALSTVRRSRVRRDRALRALTDLGLLRSDNATATKLSKAVTLLFGRDPRRAVRGATVQLVRRGGVGPGREGPTTDRTEIVGALPTLVDEAIAWVESRAPRVSIVVGTQREVLPAYPPQAVREAVLNAVAHRDYALAGSTVDITIWDDRIEIRSPGGLPGHITLENMREEHYSRNRVVMAGLKLLGLVEEYGEGIDRMFSAMDARLMDPPTIHATRNSVTVTLFTRSLLSPEDQAWSALLGNVAPSGSERRMLVLAKSEGSVTPRRLRRVMPTVDPDLLIAAAVARGLLVRTGERGGTRYVLSDEVVMRAGASGLEARGRQRQKILDEIRRRGSMSGREAEALIEETPFVVRQLLRDLTLGGQIVESGRTRGRRYYDPRKAPRGPT
jgi:ATP-dependent DNA helicase RecG